MHNDHYQSLHTLSQQNPQSLGVSLPAMTRSALTLTSLTCTAAQVCQQVEQLQATQGWLMYRDSLVLTAAAPERSDFIEGEWCNEHKTIKVKHLRADTYLCVSMAETQPSAVAQQFSEQVIYLRNDLQGEQHNAAIYRQWYEQALTGDSEGRWLPLAQQFIGFTYHQKMVTKEAV